MFEYFIRKVNLLGYNELAINNEMSYCYERLPYHCLLVNISYSDLSILQFLILWKAVFPYNFVLLRASFRSCKMMNDGSYIMEETNTKKNNDNNAQKCLSLTPDFGSRV